MVRATAVELVMDTLDIEWDAGPAILQRGRANASGMRGPGPPQGSGSVSTSLPTAAWPPSGHIDTWHSSSSMRSSTVLA